MGIDDQTMGIIRGLIIFAVGVIIMAVGTGFEEAAQGAAYLIGIVVLFFGAFVLYKAAT